MALIEASLEGASDAVVAVDRRDSPHATPVRCVYWRGRLWFATTRSSVKGRAIDEDTPVGVVVTAGDTLIALTGTATTIDPLQPNTLARDPGLMALVPGALSRIGRTHWRDVVGAARDLASRDARAVLEPRVLITITADEIIDAGPREERAGDEIDAVVAVAGRRGPVALPAAWDDERKAVFVRSELFDRSGVAATDDLPCAIYLGPLEPAYRVSAQQGALIRGTMRKPDPGGWSKVVIDAARATVWEGTEMRTVDLAESD